MRTIRSPRGSECQHAVLDEEAVRQILAAVSTESTHSIARRMGVSQMTVSLIRQGKTWKHVPRPPDYAPPQRPDWGASNVNARLTEAQAREILASSESDRVLAAKYGVRPGAIWAIRARKTWRRL